MVSYLCLGSYLLLILYLRHCAIPCFSKYLPAARLPPLSYSSKDGFTDACWDSGAAVLREETAVRDHNCFEEWRIAGSLGALVIDADGLNHVGELIGV